MGRVAAASYLVSCLPVLLAESVVKCCPPGLAIGVNKTCVRTRHTWSYANITYGMPSCDTHMVFADRGVRVSCADYCENLRTFVGLICSEEDPSENTFVVPDINVLRKCCPKGRAYSTAEQTCWSDEVYYDEWAEQHLLNIVLSGSPGLIDLVVGAPVCDYDEVLVDHVIPRDNIWREDSEAIRFRERGNSEYVIMNPDEVCVDITEWPTTLVVRACLDSRVICPDRLCTRKCCPDGEIYSDRNCISYTGRSGPRIAFSMLEPLNRSIDRLAYFFGDPCGSRGKYIVKLESVELSLNGSIYFPNISQYVDFREYCFEHVKYPNTSTAVDSLMVCFEDLPEESNFKFVIQSVAMLISCFFLFITMAVYCALPSLHQNIHGKTLICYIGCLICGYVCLSSVQLAQDFFPDTTCLILGMHSSIFYCNSKDFCLFRYNSIR